MRPDEHPDSPGSREFDVAIPDGRVEFAATMHTGDAPIGMVVFAHGSGSSRFSPRNRFVADTLHEVGFATLLVDLLLPEEELDRANVFDMELLGGRVIAATEWLGVHPEAPRHPVALFGASTGAGAALWAAGDPAVHVAAIVSRGGRPDLAASRLPGVRAPTLLIVGGADTTVIELNRKALQYLVCPAELSIVPHATHLFQEPGALEQVAILARDWLLRQIAETSSARGRRHDVR